MVVKAAGRKHFMLPRVALQYASVAVNRDALSCAEVDELNRERAIGMPATEEAIALPGPAARCIAAALLVVLATASAESAQTKSPGNGEVLPPPPGIAAAVGDPLAKLIGNDASHEGLRGINELTTDIRIKDLRDGRSGGDLPANVAKRVLSSQATYANGRERRPWAPLCYYWEASGLFSQPLYFEDWNLERYGYSPRGLRIVQPLVSAGRFYLTIFTLPYQMVVHPPREPVYSLGYYRPGSPAPYRFSRPQIRPLAGVAAAGAWIGLIFLIP
jgi:hypothetical protein